MANYKLVDMDKLNDLINELEEYYNSDNQLKYIIEDLRDLVNMCIRGGY